MNTYCPFEYFIMTQHKKRQTHSIWCLILGGNQRDLARAKAQKKLADTKKGLRGDGLTVEQRKARFVHTCTLWILFFQSKKSSLVFIFNVCTNPNFGMLFVFCVFFFFFAEMLMFFVRNNEKKRKLHRLAKVERPNSRVQFILERSQLNIA